MNSSQPSSRSSGGGLFGSTHWSVVLQAGAQESTQAREALGELCRTYWRPVYVYVRRRGYAPPDAEDLTQGFFAHLLEGGVFAKADPDRGRFRSFLLSCLQHHLVNHQRHEQAVRRQPPGGTFVRASEIEPRLVRDPNFGVDPEKAYARQRVLLCCLCFLLLRSQSEVEQEATEGTEEEIGELFLLELGGSARGREESPVTLGGKLRSNQVKA